MEGEERKVWWERESSIASTASGVPRGGWKGRGEALRVLIGFFFLMIPFSLIS